MLNEVKLSSIYLLFAVLLFASCGSKNNDPPDEMEEYPEGQNVYAAGFENNAQGNPVGKVWKNGVLQTFTKNAGGIVRTSETDGSLVYSTATAIYVSGDDVFVTGFELLTSATVPFVRARLWKNGAVQHLDNRDFDHVAISIFVSGDDVYVLGYEFIKETDTANIIVWKNGKAEMIADIKLQYLSGVYVHSFSRIVNSIFVSDGVVYIAGFANKQAKLWKNGEVENLDGGECAQSVFVSGEDVYVAGYGDSGAKLWKNGNVINLANAGNNSGAFSVYVSGDDVYVAGHAGFSEGSASLWKNGIIQDFPDVKDAIMFRSVFIKNDDVYVGGYVWAVQEVEPGSGIIPVTYLKATLWRNGKKLKLDVGKKYNSELISVFVN